MRVQWARICTLSSPRQPQGRFWTSLLQKGALSAAEDRVVRQLQHLQRLRSSAAPAFWLSAGLGWFAGGAGLALPPVPAAPSCFPRSTPSTAPAAASPLRPTYRVRALCRRVSAEKWKTRALSPSPTGGHCPHAVWERQARGSGLAGERGGSGTPRAVPCPVFCCSALCGLRSSCGAVCLCASSVKQSRCSPP